MDLGFGVLGFISFQSERMSTFLRLRFERIGSQGSGLFKDLGKLDFSALEEQDFGVQSLDF